MSLQIGRCTIASDDVEVWPQDGDRVRISGALIGSSVADSLVLRQQLVGYDGNTDEPIVPVAWSEDSTRDGWYRILSTSVSTVPASLVAGWFRYQVEMVRMPGYSQPRLEHLHVGQYRTNVHGVESGYYYLGVPSAHVNFGITGNGYDGYASRTTDSGALTIYGNQYPTITPAAAFEATASYYLPIASSYVGAATIEVGTSLATVVGRQVPLSTNWRLSNGLVRVTPSASAGKIDIAHYDGTQWETAKTYRLRDTSLSVDVAALTSFTVLRNDPASVSIRLGLSVPHPSPTFLIPLPDAPFLDLTLRRGSRFVEGHITNDHSWLVRRDTAEAATAVSPSGIRATANDAGGNRFVMFTPHTKTNDLVNGGFTMTPAGGCSFVIGSEIGGSGSTGIDTAAELQEQFWASQTDRLVVVGQ